jgi:uroporphyrinogen decarboxylase
VTGMTSRQRVITALAHQEPDRVPFDCTFSYLGYRRLVEHLGYKSEFEVKPGGPFLSVNIPVGVLEELNVDLLYVGMGPGRSAPIFEYGMDTFIDEWGIPFRKIDNPYGLYYEFYDPPLAKAEIKDLDQYPWPDPHDPARIDRLGKRVNDLRENSSFALVGKFNNPIFEQSFMLRGMQQLFLDFAIQPDFVEALMDKLTEIAIGFIEAGLKACGKDLDILRLAGDDMGHQGGTLVSPTMFRRVIKPRFEKLYKSAKTLFQQYNLDGKLMAHTDGDVYPLVEDYIGMGLDILNPVQPYVAEMEHDKLKKEFGNRLSFHGGIDIQRVMPFGTPDEVCSEVIKTIKSLAPGGGYILAPTHYLQPDVPPENVLALRNAVLEFGKYPLISR